MIIPGTKPNDTMSANESNCFPSSEGTFSNRATKPSRKSARVPIKTNNIPNLLNSLRKASDAMQPHAKFAAVRLLGMIDFKFSRKDKTSN